MSVELSKSELLAHYAGKLVELAQSDGSGDESVNRGQPHKPAIDDSPEETEPGTPEPSNGDTQELAELLRQTRELRMRAVRLADECDACYEPGAIPYEDRPFQAALLGVIVPLGEAAVSANAYLVDQVLGEPHLTCVCGSGNWTMYHALGPAGDEPVCAKCENCGLRMTVQVLPSQPPQEHVGSAIPF